MDTDRLDHRIEKIEQELLRGDPTLNRQFAKLDRVNRRHEATVFTLLVSSAVFLTMGLATTSIVAWLVGAVSFVAAFSVDTRHERQLRTMRSSIVTGRPRGRQHRDELGGIS